MGVTEGAAMISRPTRASSVRDDFSLEGGEAIEMNRGSLRSRSSTLDTGTNERTWTEERVITATTIKAKVSFTG